MNFLLKSVLRKIFTQYLYIQDEGLDLASGVIKLPQGNINQTRINEKLEPMGIRVLSSSYKNLIIHLPLAELMSKPVRVSIEVLDLVVEKVYNEEGPTRKESESSVESSDSGKEGKEEKDGKVVQPQGDGYFRNLINRLLYNMEVCMQRINVRLVDIREEEEFREARFTLQSFRLKNSLVILEANIIKKTLTLDQLHIRHTVGELVVKDLSLCLDFSHKKLQVIAVGHSIKVNVFNVPYAIILKAIGKKPKKVAKKKSQLLGMSIFLKLNIISVNFQVIELSITSLQVKSKSNEREQEVNVKFGEIKCCNMADGKEQGCLVGIGYLPFDKLAKINSEFQDSAIKQCSLSLKMAGQAVSGKIYHLLISIDANAFKDLLDKLVLRERQIQKMKQIISKLKNQPKTQQVIVQTQPISLDILIYRAALTLTYGPMKTEIFGTSLLQVKPAKQEKDNLTILKVYQLGIQVFGYSLLQMGDLHAKIAKKEVIVNGNSLASQISLHCVGRIKEQAIVVQRDVAYYQEKIKKHLPVNKQKDKDKEENIPSNLSTLPKVFVKVDQIMLSIGELIEDSHPKKQQQQNQVSHQFISIIQVQLSRSLVSLSNEKVRVNTEVIAFITSPYTLHRTPLTNELQVQLLLGLNTNELSIGFKNKLVLLIQDHYINIIYKLLDKEDVWCFVSNLTNQTVYFLQEAPQYSSFMQRQEKEQMKASMMEEKREEYRTTIKGRQRTHLFWVNNCSFRVGIGNRLSQTLSAQASSHQIQPSSGKYGTQAVREVLLSQDKDHDFILRMMYNKLGNLCEIVVDHKTLITSYCKDYTFKIGPHAFAIAKSGRQKWEWFPHLQDLLEDFVNYEVMSEGKTLKIQQLMAHQQFNLMGIFENMPNEHPAGRKLYQAYIHQSKSGGQVKCTIMPLLIIRNQSFEDFQVEITDKKSQQHEIVVVKRHTGIELGHNGRFDYYLRQFTIKITALGRQGQTYESEQLYFNTFFMVDHKTETKVQLRSTQKNNFSKKALILEESLILKTKVIALRSSLRITNSTDFNFTLQARDPNRTHSEKIEVDAHAKGEWTYRLKEDTILEFLINRQPESKVQTRYGDLREMKLLSFNFCKIDDKFFNVLIRVELRTFQGVQTLNMDHFVELVNLCNFASPISLENFPAMPQGIRCNLPLNSTSLSKYNNKLVPLDDIAKIYAELFLTAKVTDLPLSMKVGTQAIRFDDLLKQSSREAEVGTGRFVITLLKDMNSRRITFYITDRLFHQKQRYTVFSNDSARYFLLSDDAEYAPHFSAQQQRCASPQKVLVNSKSFNVLLNRQNYDLLLCDQFQTHLEKIDKKVLQRQSLRLQQFHFDSVTLYDCMSSLSESARRQFTSREIEIRVKMYGKMELSVGVQALTVRLLQQGKLDCLIQDISVRNEDSKDHLLRIPEETYLLVEGRAMQNGYFLLLKNLFLKCKNIIVNIRRQVPYSLIELVANLSERLGLHLQPDLSEQVDPRRVRESVKRLNGEAKLRSHISEALLLIRNLYIHEIHLSLTIQLENLSFSNVIILPYYQLLGKFQKGKSFADSLTNFYLTALLAKFPKLSFLMANFSSPLNTIRLFFNVREAMRRKVESQAIIDFNHPEFPTNPFHFSAQRCNVIQSRIKQGENGAQRVVAYLFHGKQCLILTNSRVYWLDEEWKSWALRELQSLKIIRGRGGSELVLKFRQGQLSLVQQHKKCIKMLNSIQQHLL